MLGPRHDSANTSASPMPSPRKPVILSIAGFDPSGGAGVLADVKTFAAFNVYGMACITALTVQSTQGVRRVKALDPGIVLETLDCLAEDVSFAAIKVGMLGSAAVAAAVLDWLGRSPEVPVVLDPVLKSSSGHDLADDGAVGLLSQGWLGRVQWVTPNLAELAALTGAPAAKSRDQVEQSARQLHQIAAQRGNSGLRIVVTGGHAASPDDFLLTAGESRWFPGRRVETSSTHGTGCTFSSALAARLALGDGEVAAVEAAKEYVAGALRHAFPVGSGNGPLHHFWRG